MPLTRRRVLQGAGAWVGAVAVAGCSDVKDSARGRFQPRAPGVLVVAAVLPAPGFWEADGAGVLRHGFEGEVAARLADRFGLGLEVMETGFDDLDRGRLGDADLALAQISITDERQERITFSVPYLTTDAAVLGRPGEELRDLATARDRRWAAVSATTDLTLVRSVVRPDAQVREVHDDAAAAAAVAAGEVDHAMVDLHSAMALVAADDRVALVARFDTDEQIAAAVGGSGDRQRANRLAVDAAIRALAADGTLADLEGRWLRPAGAPDPDDVTVIRAR